MQFATKKLSELENETTIPQLIHVRLTSPSSYNPEQLAPTVWAAPFCNYAGIISRIIGAFQHRSICWHSRLHNNKLKVDHSLGRCTSTFFSCYPPGFSTQCSFHVVNLISSEGLVFPIRTLRTVTLRLSQLSWLYNSTMQHILYIHIHNTVQLASIILGQFYQQSWHSIIGLRLNIVCQCLPVDIYTTQSS